MSPLKFLFAGRAPALPANGPSAQPSAQSTSRPASAQAQKPVPPPVAIARRNAPPACPYCRAPVAKIPKYKAICDRCGKTYYARVRPGESHPALVTARQVAALDENRATQPRWLRLATAAEAQEERNYNWFWAHSTAEAQWRKLSRAIAQHAHDGNWLLFRNARFEMAEIRRKQARLREALDLYLEVWYFDLNGPRDAWGASSTRRIYESAPFSPAKGISTPVVARWVNRLGVRLELDRQQLQERFDDVAVRAYRGHELPLPPADAWRALAPEIVV